MRQSQFRNLLASLGHLSAKQAVELIDELTSHVERISSFQAIDSVLPTGCPRCASTAFTENGLSNGLQRYLCKDCGASFGATTGTSLANLRRKDRFEAFASCMTQGLSVRDAAGQLGVAVSTAFRWRHRFLNAVTTHQPAVISGILETDETYFRYSEKGKKTGLTRPARPRGGGKGLGAGRKHSDWIAVMIGRARGQPYTVDAVIPVMTSAQVERVLAPCVDPAQTLVCCDGHTAFSTLPTKLGVTTKVCVASHKTAGADPLYHAQSANNYHERLKTWINRGLRGVATKYLANYLAWMRLMSREKNGVSPKQLIQSAMGKQVINI